MLSKYMCLMLVLSSLSLCAEATVVQVKVKVNRVILRLKPSFDAEVIAQAQKGDILDSTGAEGDWVQVLPPPNVFFWVHSRYVNNGIVLGSKVPVRMGPDIKRDIVEDLRKGERVVTAGSWNGWTRIRPPKGCLMWVHSAMVERVDPEDISSTAAMLDDVPVSEMPRARKYKIPRNPTLSDQMARMIPEISDGTRSSAVPASLIKLGLVPLSGQGKRTKYAGTIYKEGFFTGGPTGFRLVQKVEGKRGVNTICYVMGNNEQLAELVNVKLLVEGLEYWLIGEKFPVVVLDQIVLKEKSVGIYNQPSLEEETEE